MLDPTSVDFEESHYTKALDACNNFDDVRTLLTVLPDDLTKAALKSLEGVSDEEWGEFLDGLKAQRRGEDTEEVWVEKWGEVLLPGPMLLISLYSLEFKTPWSVVYAQFKRVNPPKWKEIIQA